MLSLGPRVNKGIYAEKFTTITEEDWFLLCLLYILDIHREW